WRLRRRTGARQHAGAGRGGRRLPGRDAVGLDALLAHEITSTRSRFRQIVAPCCSGRTGTKLFATYWHLPANVQSRRRPKTVSGPEALATWQLSLCQIKQQNFGRNRSLNRDGALVGNGNAIPSGKFVAEDVHASSKNLEPSRPSRLDLVGNAFSW